MDISSNENKTYLAKYKQLIFETNDLVELFNNDQKCEDKYFILLAFSLNFVILTNLIISVKKIAQMNRMCRLNHFETSLKNWSLEVYAEAELIFNPEKNNLEKIEYVLEIDQDEINIAEEGIKEYLESLNIQ